MGTLKCRRLGSPLIDYKGRDVKLETRKAAAPLAYLSLTPGECQREVLAAMFWQDDRNSKPLCIGIAGTKNGSPAFAVTGGQISHGNYQRTRKTTPQSEAYVIRWLETGTRGTNGSS